MAKGYKIIGEYKNANEYVLCEKNNGIRCFASYTNLKVGKSPIIWGKYNYENLEHNINIFLKEQASKSCYICHEIIRHKNRTRCLVTMKCECGIVFKRTLEDLIYKKYPCCRKCSIKKRAQTRCSHEAFEIVSNAGYKILFGDKNYRKLDMFEVEDVDGYRGFISANNVNRGCKISKFDRRINEKYYIHNVNVWAKQENIEAICLGFDDNRFGTRQGLKFRCSCGKEFSTTISSFQNGKFRCEECAKSISRLEFLFKNYLDEIREKYIYQYSLNQCRDILPLPFDFYLADKNILVEIDGEGHYYPCNFNQISIENAIKTFDITKKHDEIKNRFCEENNIKLIRIPYFLFDSKSSYKDFFQKSLNE